jgi:hypothetical protein
MSDASDLDRLNDAADELSQALLADAVDRAQQYVADGTLDESDVSLVLANALLRLAVNANAVAFSLDAEELGRRVMQLLKSAARE